MTVISSRTRELIKGFLEGFIQGLVEEYKSRIIEQQSSVSEYLSKKSSSAGLKPFHAALMPSEVIRISQFERGFSTRLGSSLEECARLIALEHHKIVYRGYKFDSRS